MKTLRLIKSVLLFVFLALVATPVQAAPLGTAFTYQGLLTLGGSPADGLYDLRFTLFRQGDPMPIESLTLNSVMVTRGAFTVSLGFGAGGDFPPDGAAYELSLAVREAGGGQFTTLGPRQPLTPTPFALRAQTVGSVPDTALSSNVALLNGSPMFTTPIKVTALRVANSAGGGVLSFGNNPDNICAIAVEPQGPTGLLLRDPSGIRIVVPAGSTGQPVLRFGPTDDCSIGIDPALSGLRLRDPGGLRIAPTSPTAVPRLLFGPTDDCSVGIDPVITGLVLRDPRGVRFLSPDPVSPPVLRFGPTDDCSIGIDPGFAGLLLRDPSGIRILPPSGPGATGLPRLLFGPTDDCSIGIDPARPGLIVEDPSGLRIDPPTTTSPPRLLFGPTDDCSIGIDPGLAGLILRDPRGVRIATASPGAQQRLIFGPTDDCSIGIDPALAGLIVRDPKGLRIAPTNASMPPRLLFGPTDDCSIGIDPAFPGLIERDPIGLRLMGTNNQGGRLLFGPTDLCTIEIRPPGTPGAVSGLLLRDPSGTRLLTPSPTGTNILVFGPTDNCRITAAPIGGMRFSDPMGFTFGSQMTVNGPVFAQAFVQTSSRRFKNDVKPIEEPLEKISKLQGVRFTWNEEKGGSQDIGFIAEDVAKVIPELVSMEEDGKNARGVNYDHLVAVAIEGIKAQQTKIETLEREKSELKENLASMQERLEKLARQVEALAAR